MLRGSEDVPLPGCARSRRRPLSFHQLHRECPHPRLDAIRHRLRLVVSRQRGGREFVQRPGQVGQRRGGKGGRDHGRGDAQFARRLVHDLADGYRRKVQLVQGMAAWQHRIQRKLGPLRGEAAQDFQCVLG